ncbi:MAG: sensor histidine kinase [Chthoniobacterales bacterium]
MSLRLKSLLIFSAAVTLLFALVLGLVKIFIERQFADIERNEMAEQAGRFSIDMRAEEKVVASVVGDWAPWDDLYNYVEGSNPGFVEDNLNGDALDNLQFDFIAVWRQDGTLVVLQTRSEILSRNSITPEMLADAMRKERLIPQRNVEKPASGFMLVGGQLATVAALPIVHTDRTGEPIGTIVGGKIFGQQSIMSLEKFAGFQLSIVPRPGPEADVVAQPTPVVRTLDAQTIAADVPIENTRGEIIAYAELSSGRPLHLQAGGTTRIFIIALASAGGILLFVVWYLLDVNVIHPVRKLGARLAEAASHGQLPSDLGVTGEGELADLARRIEDLAKTVAHTEASYRAIVEEQTDYIFRYLPDGRLTFVNEALCRYFRTARADLIGGDAHRLVAEEDIERVQSAIGRLTAASSLVTLEHLVNAPGGGVAWFRRTDRAIFSDSGELKELQCVARDVTQAHLTRERLEASETRYRRLFETATDGILIVRQSSRTITDVNPALCRILGCDRTVLLEKTIEAVPAFKTQKSLRALAKLLQPDQSVESAELTVTSEEGSRHYLEVTAGIYESGGEAIVQLNFRDITLRRHASDELRQLSGQLLRLQDEERRRIARELHDSTAQNLSALQMAVTQLESAVDLHDARARMTLDEVRNLADLSQREIRTISYLLHPPLLDEVGLIFALRWYVDGFMTRTEKIVRLDMPESLDRLKPEIETTVFRVVQEALSNIHRHSGSRRAWIRLAVENGILKLEIRDEGRGVSPSSIAPGAMRDSPVMGVGIAGMRERLRQFNGSLEIESGRVGTTVRATLPVEFDESKED